MKDEMEDLEFRVNDLEGIESKDLAPSMFNRLVTRRMRCARPGEDFEMPSDDSKRMSYEEELEKISGENNLLPVSFLHLGSTRARSICRVVVPTRRGRSLGTGFLVAPNLIMTNNHVIESRREAENALAEFFYEENADTVAVSIRPDRFFVTSRSLDFTIVACEGRGLEGVPFVQLRSNPAVVTRHERVNIIQHPRGRKKEVALHDNRVLRVQDRTIQYSTDTMKGTSGAGVFNNDWDLVALHRAGVSNRDGTAINKGVNIAAIVDYLKRLSRRQGGNNQMMLDLMNHIESDSSVFGFFGSEGLGLSELEVQVDGFSGTPDFADVGFWNIEHFNDRISSRKIDQVGSVIDKLALDALGLSEVESGALDRLKLKLREKGGRYDYVLRDTRGSQDLAILYNQDTTEVELLGNVEELYADKLNARTSNGKTAFPRWPLFAKCTVNHEGASVNFIMIVVHLKAFGDQQSRARRKLASEMLSEIINDIQNREGLPVVLGGDFNETINNDALLALTDSPDLFPLTTDDAADGAISYVGQRHRSLIDHIIVSKDLKLGEISNDDAAIVRLDRTMRDFADQISDHVPLVFRMIMRDEAIDANGTQRDDGALTLSVPEGATSLKVAFE